MGSWDWRCRPRPGRRAAWSPGFPIVRCSTRSRAAPPRGRSRAPRVWPAPASSRFSSAESGPSFTTWTCVLAPTTAAPPLTIGATQGLTSWATDRLVAGALRLAVERARLARRERPGRCESRRAAVGVQLLGQPTPRGACSRSPPSSSASSAGTSARHSVPSTPPSGEHPRCASPGRTACGYA